MSGDEYEKLKVEGEKLLKKVRKMKKDIEKLEG